jgi:hypothetical protein
MHQRKHVLPLLLERHDPRPCGKRHCDTALVGQVTAVYVIHKSFERRVIRSGLGVQTVAENSSAFRFAPRTDIVYLKLTDGHLPHIIGERYLAPFDGLVKTIGGAFLVTRTVEEENLAILFCFEIVNLRRGVSECRPRYFDVIPRLVGHGEGNGLPGNRITVPVRLDRR